MPPFEVGERYDGRTEPEQKDRGIDLNSPRAFPTESDPAAGNGELSTAAYDQTTPNEFEPKPDAPTGRWPQILLAAVPGALAGSIFLVLAWGFSPAPPRSRVIVKLNARDADFVYVAAPTSGVFRTDRVYAHNDPVKQVEVVGKIEPSEDQVTLWELERKQLESRVDYLEKQRLLDETEISAWPERNSSVDVVEQRLQENEERRRTARNDLESVIKKINTVREVKALDSGLIHRGIPGAKQVKEHEVLFAVWPTGRPLQVEVEGPQELIFKLLKKKRFRVNVSAPVRSVSLSDDGAAAGRSVDDHDDQKWFTLEVEADGPSLRSYPRDREGGKVEIWAVLQCKPEVYETSYEEQTDTGALKQLVALAPGLPCELADD